MAGGNLNVVIGAFGFTGRAITRLLLDGGTQVRALTRKRLEDSPFGDRVPAFPLDFQQPDLLRAALEGASTLYNTYWVRFPRGKTTFQGAVENSGVLFQAAREAGVRRVVHISIANASETLPQPYFWGKGAVERNLAQSGLSYVILRPTLVFGPCDVLLNNIAWLLRRFPVFPIFGSGTYRVQPVHVEDVAEAAVDAGQSDDDFVKDVAGPEVLSFETLVRLVREKVGSRTRIVHMPSALAPSLTLPVSWALRDVVLTRDELRGLMAELLVSREPPVGARRLSSWLEANADGLGRQYASEMERHYRER